MSMAWFRARIFESSATERKAASLLRSNLTRIQLGRLERYGYFEVIGGATGRRYRIHIGASVNVVELSGPGNGRVLCFMPAGDLPTGDVMLAQKIALESFELETLAIAKRY